jgi:YegS/Rv2252/BmrU family lipid kinase
MLIKESHIILNPAAGRGKAQNYLRQISEFSQKLFTNCSLHITRHADHTRELAASFSQKEALVVAAGGDGTIHHVTNGLAGGKAVLGVIPIGTGNDFARTIGVPEQWQQAMKVLLDAEIKSIDLGKANERYFINGVGIGFDADVMLATKTIPVLSGFSLYLAAVLKKVVHYENRHLNYKLNGECISKDIFLLAAGNGKYVGGGFNLFPLASTKDGMLDLCILNALNRREIFRYLPHAIKGTHVGLPQVYYQKFREISIQCQEGIPGQIDGELFGSQLTELKISVQPQKIKLMVPKKR